MNQIQRIKDFENIKTLSDARRLTILRLLMGEAMTLSHLGQALGEHPARVRHHLLQLEKAGLVELVDTRVVRGFVEKYYRAKAEAFTFQELILPAVAGREVIPLMGSHDLALEALARQINERPHAPLKLLTLPVGSLDGLVALRQGTARLAGCHLLDADTGEYNLPYVHSLFPDRQITLITMAYREQGLIVAKGNPLHLRGIEDLASDEVMMVNRNRGSGTRLWLDSYLTAQGIPVESLRGYTLEAHTHSAVAQTILRGQAQAGLGLRAAARQAGLDFVPLFEERFDLVLPREQVSDPNLLPIFDYLTSAAFRQTVDSLGGYQTAHTGDQLNP